MLAPFPLNPILPAQDGPRAEAFHSSIPAPSSFAGQEGVIAGVIIDFGPVRSTWLRDSEGNILALNELVG